MFGERSWRFSSLVVEEKWRRVHHNSSVCLERLDKIKVTPTDWLAHPRSSVGKLWWKSRNTLRKRKAKAERRAWGKWIPKGGGVVVVCCLKLDLFCCLPKVIKVVDFCSCYLRLLWTRCRRWVVKVRQEFSLSCILVN